MLRVSWSSMSNGNTCEYRWFLNYIARVRPTRYSEALSKGSLVHKMISHHFDMQVEKTNLSADSYVNLHKDYCNELMKELDPRAFEAFMIASYVVTSYIRDYQPAEESHFVTVASEIEVEAKMTTPQGNEFVLNGIIDRILQNKRTKKLLLGEFKTHSAKPWSTAAIEMDGQQPIYLAIAREMGWPVDDIHYLFLNVYPYKDRTKYPYTKYFESQIVFDKAQVRQGFLNEIYKYVDRLIGSIEREEEPRRNIGRHCERCPFQSYCYIKLKGGSDAAALSTGYIKKELSSTPVEEEIDTDD